MTKRRGIPILRKAALVTFLLAAISLPACAQGFLKWPTLEVFGGYSYLGFQSTTLGFSEQLHMQGWAGAVSIPHIYSGLGLTAEASGHYGQDLEEYNFMGGAQYSIQWRSFRFTGHGLFGRARTRLTKPGSAFFEPSDLSRAWSAGGEVDIPLGPKIWLRPVEADYLTTKAFGDTQHSLRLSTGLIFTFGKH
ncbi:MAG: hypothetical protein JO356_09925 [Acidobacteria bacterium]|nr:hypothetical protein [Acidobacteriota bacterium]